MDSRCRNPAKSTCTEAQNLAHAQRTRRMQPHTSRWHHGVAVASAEFRADMGLRTGCPGVVRETRSGAGRFRRLERNGCRVRGDVS
jgi:hypothetical protein